MQWKEPKNSAKYDWTAHAKMKMRHYGLSEQAVRRVVRAPRRVEEGVVKKTIAVMRPPSMRKKDGKESWTQEVWVMYQTVSPRKKEVAPSATAHAVTAPSSGYVVPTSKIRIISAWRYPGVSPHNNPIPREILEELGDVIS